jgi:exonuclease III
LRIDLALGTAPVAARLVSVEVDREERKESSGEGKPSDHAPVIVTLSD